MPRGPAGGAPLRLTGIQPTLPLLLATARSCRPTIELSGAALPRPLQRLGGQSAHRPYERMARDVPYRMSVPSAKAPSAYSLRWWIANGIAHLLNR